MILHTINKPPITKSAFNDCLDVIQTGDSALMIEDGVYAAIRNSTSAQRIASFDSTVKFYVLDADVLARGIQAKICSNVTLIDYHRFVELAAQASSISSWY